VGADPELTLQRLMVAHFDPVIGHEKTAEFEVFARQQAAAGVEGCILILNVQSSNGPWQIACLCHFHQGREPFIGTHGLLAPYFGLVPDQYSGWTQFNAELLEHDEDPLDTELRLL
jgi:hypothetical protein